MSGNKIMALIQRLKQAKTVSERKGAISSAVNELKLAGLSDNEIISLFKAASIFDRGHGEPIIKSETIDSWKSNEDDYLALLKEVLKDSE